MNLVSTLDADPLSTYLSMGEDSGDVEAAWALDIHEETVRSLNQALELVLVLLVSR